YINKIKNNILNHRKCIKNDKKNFNGYISNKN
ncbi:hypothetical protein KY3_00145, partial [Campylobacter jejuni subsp. jejuni D2600]